MGHGRAPRRPGHFSLLPLLLGGLLLTARPAAGFEGSASWTFVSDYLWRGSLQYLDVGQPSGQTDLWFGQALGPGTLGLDLWSSRPLSHLTEVHRQIGNALELIPTLDYTVPLIEEVLELTVGFTLYTWPRAEQPSVTEEAEAVVFCGEELNLGAAYATDWVDLEAKLAVDFRLLQGAYLELQLSHGFELSERLSVTPGLLLGGGHYLLDELDPWLREVTPSVALEFAPVEGVLLGLAAGWTFGDPLGQDSTESFVSQRAWGSCVAGVEF